MSRVLIMAGGTGGHVIPGLAVAEVLRNRGEDVCWLGTVAGIESTLVPAAGIPLHTLSSKGLRASGWSRVATAPFMLIQSLWQALVVLRRLRPAVVLGMGGYAAGPGGVAAWLLRVPVILHEQNSVTGLTNRLLRPLARVMLYGFPQPAIVGKSNHSFAHVIGNPVPKAVVESSVNARTESGSIRLLILGGSQGARALNRVVAEFCRTQRASQDGDVGYEIWHQCGNKLLHETRLLYFTKENDGQNKVDAGSDPGPFRLEGFIADMAAAYRWADIVIARAGALTISELCLARKPSILVPLPSAVDDHQTANANYLAEQQATILLPQNQLSVASLDSALALLTDPERRQKMADAAGKLARPEAAQQLADTCMEWCNA